MASLGYVGSTSNASTKIARASASTVRELAAARWSRAIPRSSSLAKESVMVMKIEPPFTSCESASCMSSILAVRAASPLDSGFRRNDVQRELKCGITPSAKRCICSSVADSGMPMPVMPMLTSSRPG